MKIKDPACRILETLAFYFGLFFLAIAIPTMACYAMTANAFYYWWTIGFVLCFAFCTCAYIILRISYWVDK